MKVLWVCNIPIPRIAVDMGIKVPNICGWLTGYANSIDKMDDIELSICFPLMSIKEVIRGKIGRIKYYAFAQPKLLGMLPVEDQLHTSKQMVKHLDEIIKTVSPDILHVFGTEYPHSLLAIKLFNKPNRSVIHIQGLTSFYYMHFNLGIPNKELKKFTFSNLVRGNFIQQAQKLKKRGEFEIKSIESVEHVMGRTDWDKACALQINNSLRYHFCNESLRDVFYEGDWDYNNCEKYSIFMSQSSTPIKGLHFMIIALPEILKIYPNTHLYIAGNNILEANTFYKKLKFSNYAKYIKKLIDKYHIKNNITFLGKLDEWHMKERLLMSHVFVSASTIENSPNSLGEAMLLGVPCVSSDVGGVKNMLIHEKEGYIYQADAPYMLAYYVKKIFSDSSLAYRLGRQAKSHAQRTHNREHNLMNLIAIYKEMSNE